MCNKSIFLQYPIQIEKEGKDTILIFWTNSIEVQPAHIDVFLPVYITKLALIIDLTSSLSWSKAVSRLKINPTPIIPAQIRILLVHQDSSLI